MKIFDATTIIAIFDEINRPDLMDRILELGHEIAIPSHIMESELVSEPVRKLVQSFVRQGKMQILEKNSTKEIQAFQKRFPGLGLGESDAMLAYQKLEFKLERVYCVLDDQKARAKASEHDIRHTGLIGLLKMLRDRDIVEPAEIYRVVTALKDSGFRIPKDIVI